MSQPYIDFAYVKEHASFERVLEHYDLKPRGTGAQRSICCPFHLDKKPSCRVELDRKVFHCFACGASGNILEFVAFKLGDKRELRAAAMEIAEICGIATAAPRATAAKSPRPAEHRRKVAVPTPDPKPRSPAPPAGSEGAINPPLTFTLKLDPEHPYLVERGLSAETIAEFGLGYCNRGTMAGRICIPIHNEIGALVAYAGRWPGDDLPDGQERYKLPAKFEKGRVLFSLHRLSDAEHVVLVEGYWSAFRLHALGVPVVGLMGSSVSPAQLALLHDRGTRYLTLLFDGDAAGRKARERALPELASAFFVRAPLLPDGEKPDTLGQDALLDLIDFP